MQITKEQIKELVLEVLSEADDQKIERWGVYQVGGEAKNPSEPAWIFDSEEKARDKVKTMNRIRYVARRAK